MGKAGLAGTVVCRDAGNVTGGEEGFLRQVSCPKAGMMGMGAVGISRPNTNVVGAHLRAADDEGNLGFLVLFLHLFFFFLSEGWTGAFRIMARLARSC